MIFQHSSFVFYECWDDDVIRKWHNLVICDIVKKYSLIHINLPIFLIIFYLSCFLFCFLYILYICKNIYIFWPPSLLDSLEGFLVTYDHRIPNILRSCVPCVHSLSTVFCIYATQCQNFDFNMRRDHQKNFLWASRLWVGGRKELILGYVPKNYERKNSGSNGLT